MQYNISDSQALFWCFAPVLRIAKLDTLFLYSVGHRIYCSYSVAFFLASS